MRTIGFNIVLFLLLFTSTTFADTKEVLATLTCQIEINNPLREKVEPLTAELTPVELKSENVEKDWVTVEKTIPYGNFHKNFRLSSKFVANANGLHVHFKVTDLPQGGLFVRDNTTLDEINLEFTTEPQHPFRLVARNWAALWVLDCK